MILLKLKNQRGATAVIFGIIIIMIVCFVPLAIDLVNLYVAKNELQNAADAAALAGALELYHDDGTAVNVAGYNNKYGKWIESANQVAKETALKNQSQQTSVEVNWTSGNTGDIQRGHWSFGLGTNPTLDGFSPNDSPDPIDLWGVSEEELDQDPSFINAVWVKTRRNATPVASFFARIFGYENFQLDAEAVAYIGFAGTLNEGDVDQPIAICMESIKTGDEYDCNIGRMLNSGSNDPTHNTAGWTNFSQPCHTADADEMAGLVCREGGNPDTMTYGEGIGATGGVQQSTFDQLRDCWIQEAEDTDGDGMPDKPWNLTLPVVTCPGNNVSNCADLVGAVTLNVIWITEGGTDPQYSKVPIKMGDWECSVPEDGVLCWNEFVEEFNLKNVDEQDAPYAKKSIYFLPECAYHEPAGGTGGQNFGVLAKIPVLVD